MWPWWLGLPGVGVSGDEQPVVDLSRAVEPLERDAAEQCGDDRANRRKRDCPMQAGIGLLQTVEDLSVAGDHETAEVLLVHQAHPGASQAIAVVVRRRVVGAAPVATQQPR